MAGLYDHIRGVDDSGKEVAKLEVHQFIAAAAEVLRGKITRPQAANIFPYLEGVALTQASTLVAAIDNGTITREELADVLAIAELQRGSYVTEAEVKTRLGF